MVNKCPIGIWRFSRESIDNIQRINDASKSGEIEFGAPLEGTLQEKNGQKGIINLGELCIGDECGVQLEGKARPGKIFIGEFHTHVLEEDEIIQPSDNDIVRLDKVIRPGISCIGASLEKLKERERIKCWIHKPGEVNKERARQRFEELKKISTIPFAIQPKEWKRITDRDFKEFSPYDCLE